MVVVDASVSRMDRQSPEARDEQTWSIDAALLWEILVYEKAGCCSLPENLSSVFGGSLLPNSLTPETSPQEEGQTEFDLIGSEGIAGHKTVHRQTPLHAPGQSAWSLDSSPPLQRDTPVPDVVSNEASPAFLETLDAAQGQQRFFLGADDYGRQIDAWLDLDLVP